jgi:hypothetical protein
VPLAAELDQAISIAHAFFLGEDPSDWSDGDIVSTAESIAETSGVDTLALRTFLFAERDARTAVAGKSRD